MTIEFIFESNNNTELHLFKQFIPYIVSNIQYDIYKKLDRDTCQLYEQDILNASWIVWTNKPKTIKVFQYILWILKNLQCLERRNNNYVIRFRPIMIPNTMTPIDALIRFLDKGNENCPPMYIFTQIFNEYRLNLNTYWKQYVYANTGVFPKSNIIVGGI